VDELAPLQDRQRALLADPLGCQDDPDGLAALRRALASDLSTVDRLARAFVDGQAASACRGYAVIELLATAGQHARALGFAEELIAESPDRPEPHLAAARLLVALRQPERADLELTAAEAYAPRRGVASVLLADLLREAGYAVAAIGAARQGLALAAPGDRAAAYAALVAAALAAGREDDAARAFAACARELPAAAVETVAARVLGTLGVRQVPAWLRTTPPDPRPPGTTSLAE